MESVDIRRVETNPGNARAGIALETATVSRVGMGGGLTCVTGATRLRAVLEARGWADVKLLETGELLQLHQVNGVVFELVPTDVPARDPEDWYLEIQDIRLGYLYRTGDGAWVVGLEPKSGPDAQLGAYLVAPTKVAALEYASRNLKPL